MEKTYLSLRPSEQVVATAASHIFSAYIASGLVREGNEEEWMQRSVREAIRIAELADESITSDNELG